MESGKNRTKSVIKPSTVTNNITIKSASSNDTSGRNATKPLTSATFTNSILCTPCSKDRKKVEAVNYCSNCKCYFCKMCLRDHNKFPALQEHEILDKAAMRAMKVGKVENEQEPKTAVLPWASCTDHPGNILQMYCGDHNVLCCTVCIAMDHRLCKRVDPIAELAKGIMRSQERSTNRASLDKVRKELEQLKSEKQKELSQANKTRDNIVTDIQNFKTRILARVDMLERNSIEQVQSKHKEIYDKINTDINSLGHMVNTMETQLRKSDRFRGNNEAKLFVHIKTGQKAESLCADFMAQLKDITVDTIPFELNNQIESSLNDVESFGSMVIASLVGEFDVTTKDDQTVCAIQDICTLEKNQLVIVDYRNDKLKKLDRQYRVIDTCSIPGGPFCLCRTGPWDLAISLLNSEKVQFAFAGKTMSLPRSFSVGKRCRGICYCCGELYVSCGGGYNEGPGHIRMFNLKGLLLRTIQNDKTGLSFSIPLKSTVSLDGLTIYIADKDNGLLILDRQGNKVSVLTDPRLNGTAGVCIGGHSQVYVCGLNSNNILKLDRKHNSVEEILQHCDGILNPSSVTFLHNARQLIVTSKNCGKIKVFKLT